MEPRENNFGMIRLIGAFLVISGHMFVLTGQTKVPSIFFTTVNAAGLAIFFTIGGYLITLSWLRDPHFLRYITKRIFRIFPAFTACIFFTVFVIGPLATELSFTEYINSRETWEYLKNCYFTIRFSLPGAFTQNTSAGVVNGSIWCLPVEFMMYLIVPVYVSIGNQMPLPAKRTFYGICTVIIMGVGAVWSAWFYETHYLFLGMDFSQVISVVPYYFAGALVALCKLEGILDLQAAVAVLLVAAGLNYVPALFSYLGRFLVIPYVVLSLALVEKPVFASCGLFRSGVLPDISYGMFLFSFVIQQFLIQIFVSYRISLNVWLLMGLTILCSILFGVLTERCVERPAGFLCKKILQKI